MSPPNPSFGGTDSKASPPPDPRMHQRATFGALQVPCLCSHETPSGAHHQPPVVGKIGSPRFFVLFVCVCEPRNGGCENHAGLVHNKCQMKTAVICLLGIIERWWIIQPFIMPRAFVFHPPSSIPPSRQNVLTGSNALSRA